MRLEGIKKEVMKKKNKLLSMERHQNIDKYVQQNIISILKQMHIPFKVVFTFGEKWKGMGTVSESIKETSIVSLMFYFFN